MKNIPKGDIITQSFVVRQSCELMSFLIEKKVRMSKNAIQSVLKHRLITVNGKWTSQHNHQLKAGDKVAVMKVDQSKKNKKLQGINILYEDESLLIVSKDAGILSVATDKEKQRTAYAILNKYVQRKSNDERIFVTHRMDREASGIMLFAKDMEIQRKLQLNWDTLVVEYNTYAVIEGLMPNRSGSIRSWLTENKNFHVFSSPIDNGGHEAISHYKTLKDNTRYSLIEIKQETKLKHQVRAQLQQLQRPIVGDKKYGAKTNPIKRIAVHFGKIKMRHPATNRMLEIESPIPTSILQLVKNTPLTNLSD